MKLSVKNVKKYVANCQRCQDVCNCVSSLVKVCNVSWKTSRNINCIRIFSYVGTCCEHMKKGKSYIYFLHVFIDQTPKSMEILANQKLYEIAYNWKLYERQLNNYLYTWWKHLKLLGELITPCMLCHELHPIYVSDTILNKKNHQAWRSPSN